MTRTIANQYLVVCAFAVGIAAAILVRHRDRIAILQRAYWRWLLTPWKIATALISTVALVSAAPYMRDPNWTPLVALSMSVLTFATAPWAIGEIWRRRSKSAVFAAACAWLFSSSWMFDVYWYTRRGFYPDDWFENLIASSVLYLAAGLLWNLDATWLGKLRFSFMEADWPSRPSVAPFRRLAIPVMAIMALVGSAVFVPFLMN